VTDRVVSLRLVLAHCLCWAVWAFSSVAVAPSGEQARAFGAQRVTEAVLGAGELSAGLLCEGDVLESAGAEVAPERQCERRDAVPAAAPELGAGPLTGAPMCDLTGASVEAPVDIPEVDQGRLDILPCEVVAALFGWKLAGLQLEEGAAWLGDPHPAPPPIAQGERAPAVLAAALPVLARAESSLLTALPHAGLEGSRGYRARLYRPPLPLS